MRISHRRMPMLFPDNLSVTMKYSYRIQFALVAGVGQTYTWRLNSINDPDVISAALKRPLGFDQWNAFYNDYIVYAGSIHLEFITDSPYPYEVAIGPDGDTTPPSSIGWAKELPYYKTKICNSAGASASRIGTKAAVKALEGKRIGSEDAFQALFTANPAAQKYWQLLIISSLSAANVDIRVTVWYKCRLLHRS